MWYFITLPIFFAYVTYLIYNNFKKKGTAGVERKKISQAKLSYK